MLYPAVVHGFLQDIPVQKVGGWSLFIIYVTPHLPIGQPLRAMLICNITQEAVTKSGQSLRCNGTKHELSNVSSLSITGSSSANGVTLSGTSLVVIFAEASVNTGPIVLYGSTVTLISEGASSFTSKDYDIAGVECDVESNVTLGAMSGGSFVVVGGADSVGIGPKSGGTCSSIEVSNGSVVATGGTGIGSPWTSVLHSDVANITFRDCELYAEGMSDGCGIGSGCASSQGISSVGNITFLNVSVTSRSSSNGCGIGSGYANGNAATSSVGTITIMNGNVHSSSLSYGSGIGSGWASSDGCASTVGSVSILTATVNSSSASFGCGMGSGYGTVNGVSSVVNIAVINATVNASSSSNGCGIGSGSGASSVGSITIVNGTVRSKSWSEGCGIGTTLSSGSNHSTVQSLVIVGGTVESSGAVGRAGIGSSELRSLTISGAAFLGCTSGEAIPPVGCPSIVLGNGSLVFTTNATRLFSSAPSRLGNLFICILYERETSSGDEPLQELSEILLDISNISLPNAETWTFCLAGPDGEHCFARGVSHVKSLIVSVSTKGNYSVVASSENMSGCLVTDEDEYRFEVDDDGLSLPFVHFGVVPTPTPEPTPTASRTPLATSVPFRDTSQHDPSPCPDQTAVYDRSRFAVATDGFGPSSLHGHTNAHRSSFSLSDTQNFDGRSGLFPISRSYQDSVQGRSALYIGSNRLIHTFSYGNTNGFSPSFSHVGTDDCSPSLSVAGSFSLAGTDDYRPSLSVAASFSLPGTDDCSPSLSVGASFSLAGTDDWTPSLSVAGSFSLAGTDDCRPSLSVAVSFSLAGTDDLIPSFFFANTPVRDNDDSSWLSIAAPFGPISWSALTLHTGGAGADSSALAPIWWAVISIVIAALVAVAVAVAIMFLRRKPTPRKTEAQSRGPSFDFSCDGTLLLEGTAAAEEENAEAM
jgi:hypothetical protein